MAKYLIEEVKVGVSSGGMACGPVGGNVVTEITLRDTENNSVMYYGITEVDGIENYLKSGESFYETQIKDDFDDKDAWYKVYAAETLDYDEDDPIWKLLYYFVRADWEAVEEMKSKCIGKYLEDIEIPEYDEDDEE